MQFLWKRCMKETWDRQVICVQDVRMAGFKEDNLVACYRDVGPLVWTCRLPTPSQTPVSKQSLLATSPICFLKTLATLMKELGSVGSQPKNFRRYFPPLADFSNRMHVWKQSCVDWAWTSRIKPAESAPGKREHAMYLRGEFQSFSQCRQGTSLFRDANR